MPFSAPKNEILVGGGFSAPDDEIIDGGGEEPPKQSIPARASNFLTQFFSGAFGPKALEVARNPILQPLETGAQIIKDNPEGALEALPAIAGTAAGVATGGAGFIPAILTAGAAGAGGELAKQEARKRLLGLNPVSPRNPTIPFTSQEIPDIPGVPQRASRMIIEGGLQAGPEAIARGLGGLFSKVGKTAEDAGVSAARRTQGFRQSELTGGKGDPFETMRLRGKAAKAAKESLERGDIPLSGSPYAMERNTMRALSEGKSLVDDAIKTAKISGKKLPQDSVDGALLKALDPKNADELSAALKIEQELADIVESGNVSVDALNSLRQSFGQTGYRDKTVGTAAADMYRKAHSAVGEQIKKLLTDVDPKAAAAYKSGLEKEANALTSLRGIEKQIARVEGNEFLSLPGLATQTIRRGMAPLGVAGYRGGQAAQKVAPLAQTTASVLGRGRGFLSALQESARRLLDEEKAKGRKPGKNTLMDAIRGSKPGFEKKLKESISPIGRSAAGSPAVPSLPQLKGDRLAFSQGLELFLDGDEAGAIREWQKALKINPNNLEARRGLERLATKQKRGIDSLKPK